MAASIKLRHDACQEGRRGDEERHRSGRRLLPRGAHAIDANFNNLFTDHDDAAYKLVSTF